MYQMAVGKGVQIMSVDWVEKCWELRDDPAVSATDEQMVMCSSNCLFLGLLPTKIFFIDQFSENQSKLIDSFLQST